MNKATNNSPRFTIDFPGKKIIGTKASFDKASKGFGSIYEELASKVAKHPDFELIVKQPKKQIARAKRTYAGLNDALMEDFIAIQKESEKLRREYDAVRKMAKKAGKSVYPLTKKWFLEKFSTEEKPFNVEEAKKAITAAMLVAAAAKAAAVDPEANEDQQDNNVVNMPAAVNE